MPLWLWFVSGYSSLLALLALWAAIERGRTRARSEVFEPTPRLADSEPQPEALLPVAEAS